MRAMRVIDDLETWRLIAEPTRAAILELLTAKRSVSELARALGVPRTRLYHHIRLLEGKGLIEQVDERRVRGLTERFYRLTAKRFRPSVRLLKRGDVAERADALTTLLFDTTKIDLKRSLVGGHAELERLALGRTIAYLTPEQAAAFTAELEDLVARFDAAHAEVSDARPHALIWALYPSSRRVS